jgi:pimeloyl-ACP methyl ester carboxylesterase
MTPDLAAPPIVLVHGLWLTPRSWEGWKERFESRGHRVLAPAWPRMPGEVEDVRRDPSPLNGLGIAEIAEHYAAVVRDLDRPPIIIGHSFGGVVTELLLDRGLGAAGVALSPAPIKGVLRLPIAQLRAAFPVLGNPGNRSRTVALTRAQFHYAFTNTMDAEQARTVYDRLHVPGPGRPIFEAAFANFARNAPTRVDFHNNDRPPLLVIGNGADHTVPASVSKEAATRMGKSNAVVEYREYPGRPHFTVGAPGWEEVADYTLEWALRRANALTSASAG